MLVEPRDVESGGEGLDAIEFPWSTVIGRVGGDEIGH